jgi:hypothetical protein
MTLMKSAPRRSSARTAWRRFHGPSAAVHRPEHPPARRRGGHDPPAGDDARAIDQAELDGAAHDDGLIVVRSDIPDRGHSTRQERSAGSREQQVPELARPRILALEWSRRAEARRAGRVRDQVRMAVDERGQQAAATPVVRAFWRVTARLGNFRDPPVLDGDRPMLQRDARVGVDCPHVPDSPRVHAASEVRAQASPDRHDPSNRQY